MKGSWRNLGVVETIYEEEDEYSSSSPSPLSRSLCSSPDHTPDLHCRVEEWSLATGHEPDVLIHVQETSFHLHKDPLSKRSIYLKRQLTALSELTLSPPLNITAAAFSLVADFCYGTDIAITPFNLAALRVAAELLQMTETKGEGDENLKQVTEDYFRRLVTGDQDFALVVLRSCLVLLPEAETTASLVGRCVEALSLTEYGDGIDSFVEDIITLSAEDFRIVAESMNCRFSCHDLLYRIVDIYVKEQNGNKISEVQRTKICNSIDCAKLSPEFLVHAVQNPRMPVRFIVRAMLAEQLNTRLSICSAASNHRQHLSLDEGQHHRTSSRDPLTLGAILQRDSALRQAAQLKAVMEATNSRIANLEKELDSMRKLLRESSELERSKKNAARLVGKSRNVLDSGRSASFHYAARNKVEKGERGSSSSLSVTFGRDHRAERSASTMSPLTERSNCRESPKGKINIGKKLFNGLKHAFRVSKQSKHSCSEQKKEIADCYKVDDKVGVADDAEFDYELDEDFIGVKIHDIPAYLKSGPLGSLR